MLDTRKTLSDELFLDNLQIDNVEICRTNNTIKYWTLIYFHSETAGLPELLANAIVENWFADMKLGNTKYIIFKNKVLRYEIGNAAEKEEVLNYMRSCGIPENQFNWSE